MVVNPKEADVRNLIIRAWRERWSERQWGIHIRTVLDDEDTNLSFLADLIFQQALNGPGPNNLVLSYLKHSVFSYIISTSAVLKSISQYQAFYKPFCVASLLDLLDQVKGRVIGRETDDGDLCLDLSLALQAVIYWLLSVTYSSLEKISDMTDLSELNGDAEDSRIVTKCRKLLTYFLGDPFLKGMLHIAGIEAPKVHENIQKMCRENLKFSDGYHSSDISVIISLVENLNNCRDIRGSQDSLDLFSSIDAKVIHGVNGAVQTTIMIAAMLRTTSDVLLVANDLLIIRQLKKCSGAELYCDIIQSGMIGLAEAIGKESELKFIGFTFLQLPVLLRTIRDKQRKDGGEELRKGLDEFLANESTLDVIDSKLHCGTWELFLMSLTKNQLLTEEQKETFLAKRTASPFAQKKNSSNAVIMLKAEMTVLNVLKILDGDYVTQQDKIFTVISSMLGETFETFLIAASSTGLLEQVTARLIKLNQLSKQVNGEGSKASTTRAVIFDSSFLALCHITQNYGPQYLPWEDGDCFFEEWYRDWMGVEGEAKSPDTVLAKCDSKKIDILLNQYLQGEPELKTSLVLWHELCPNSVGVVSELLFAWRNDAVSFTDVKKVLDVFRSKICALPVAIAAWLCSYIQVSREEECGKARYILEHLMSPNVTATASEDVQDNFNFKDRRRLMGKIIGKMIQSTIYSTVPGTQPTTTDCVSDRKECRELFESAWAKRANRGIMDVQTTAQMKNLLRITGPHHFVQLIIQRIYDIEHKVELMQWRDLAYGLLHMDMEECISSFISHFIPNILHFSRGELNSVEPQNSCLVSLAVDLTLSFYYHSRLETAKEEEPQAKRRKLKVIEEETTEKRLRKKLDALLKELFQDFERVLQETKDFTPNARFIFRFLREIAIKTPSQPILHGLSDTLIIQLVRVMGKSVTTNLLLALYPLREPSGRRNCERAIARLKEYHDDSIAESEPWFS